MSENKNQEQLDRYYSETLSGLGEGAQLSVEYSDEIKQWVWTLVELEYDLTIGEGTASTYEEAIQAGDEAWDGHCQIMYEAMEDVRK